MCLLGFELRTFGRAVSALNCRAISPARMCAYLQTGRTIYCGELNRKESWELEPQSHCMSWDAS